MAIARRKLGFSWMWFLLLSGLSMLSWISTYTGIMELIAASTGQVGLLPQIAVGFAVFMLQLMILYVQLPIRVGVVLVDPFQDSFVVF